VEEVEVEAVDGGGELGQGVQPGLDLAPVVVVGPVAGQLLHGRQRHALGVIVDRLALGPAGGIDAPAQLGQVLVREADPEGTDGGVLGGARTRSARLCHCQFLSVAVAIGPKASRAVAVLATTGVT
jgi:hypothetical protein